MAWCGNETLLGLCRAKERTTLEAIASRSLLYYFSNPVDQSQKFNLERELRTVHGLGECGRGMSWLLSSGVRVYCRDRHLVCAAISLTPSQKTGISHMRKVWDSSHTMSAMTPSRATRTEADLFTRDFLNLLQFRHTPEAWYIRVNQRPKVCFVVSASACVYDMW